MFKNKRNPILRYDLWWLVLILVIATAMRLGRPDTFSFNYDQAEVTLLAQQVANADALPLLGQMSSGGLPNSPMAHLLLALPFAILREPFPVTVFIALWNVLGVGLLWFAVHRYLDRRVAIFAALLYATNPSAVDWSRAIWIQDIHTPIILLGIVLALHGFADRAKWAQVLCLPVWFIGMQVHYAAWALLPLLMWLIWPHRRNIRWQLLLSSIVLAGIVMLPMLFGFVDLLSDDPDALDGASNDAPLRLRSKVFYRVLPIFTGLNIEMPDKSLDATVLLEEPLTLFFGIVLASITLLGFLASWAEPRWRKAAVPLVLWVVLPVLAFWPNWTGVYGHYFVPVLPGFCLAGGLGLAWLYNSKPIRHYRFGLMLAVMLITVITFFQAGTFFAEQDERSHDYEAFSRNLLAQMLPVRDALRRVDDVLILGGKSTFSGHQVWGALLYHSADRVGEIVVSSGGVAVFPEGEFAVLTAPHAAAFPIEDLYASDDTKTFTLREGEGVYKVAYFEEAPAWPGASISSIEPRRFASGVTLIGYAFTDDQIITQWLLPKRPAEKEQFHLSYYVHLLDEAGERIAQQDAEFWSQSYWKENDTVILWVDAPSSRDNVATLRIGQYQIMPNGNIQGFDIFDDQGNAIAPWVDIPLTDAATTE